MYPEDYLYSKDHEWISVQENVGTIGITDYAQHELGDVVYVDLPEVGDTFESERTLRFGGIGQSCFRSLLPGRRRSHRSQFKAGRDS